MNPIKPQNVLAIRLEPNLEWAPVYPSERNHGIQHTFLLQISTTKFQSSHQFSFRAALHPNCETSPKPVFLLPNHDPWWDHGDDLKLRTDKRSQNGMNLSAKERILSPRKRSHYVHYTVRTLSRYKLKTMSGVLCVAALACIVRPRPWLWALTFDFHFASSYFPFLSPPRCRFVHPAKKSWLSKNF